MADAQKPRFSKIVPKGTVLLEQNWNNREAVNDGADICGEGRMERRASAFAEKICSIILE